MSALLTAATVMTFLLNSTLSYASSSNADERIGYLASEPNPSYYVNSASAQIERVNTAYINSSASGAVSSAYTMIQNTGSSNQYADTGFLEFAGNTGSYYFFEENDGSSDYQVFTNGQSIPNTTNAVGPAEYYFHTYSVSNSVSYVQGSVDGAFSNVFYVYPSIGWNALYADYFEEVNQDAYAQFYGTSINSTTFEYADFTDTGGNTYYPSSSDWVNTNTSIGGNGGSFNMGTNSNYWFVYDTRA